MQSQEPGKIGPQAAEQFNRHERRSDGMYVAGSLASGLTTLRDCLYERLHHGMERQLGQDSMLLPLSEVRTARATSAEIEIYQIAVSASTVWEYCYISTQDDWYTQWLIRMRFGAARPEANLDGRLADYLALTADDQRLAFTNVLAEVLRESRRAPLVLFRLIPTAVKIATALAFGDHGRAFELRRLQATDLPAIDDCHECHGKVLENGEQCGQCGNPLWKYAWLTAP